MLDKRIIYSTQNDVCTTVCIMSRQLARNRVTTDFLEEGLTIVHFLNKLIVSCTEAVRFPFYFFCFVIFKLDSYFLFKLIGYFRYFTPIVHSMLKLRIHFRLVLIVCILSTHILGKFISSNI